MDLDSSPKGEDLRQALTINVGSSNDQPEGRGCVLAKVFSSDGGSPRQTLKTSVGSSRTQPKRWKTMPKIRSGRYTLD